MELIASLPKTTFWVGTIALVSAIAFVLVLGIAALGSDRRDGRRGAYTESGANTSRSTRVLRWHDYRHAMQRETFSCHRKDSCRVHAGVYPRG